MCDGECKYIVALDTGNIMIFAIDDIGYEYRHGFLRLQVQPGGLVNSIKVKVWEMMTMALFQIVQLPM